MRRAAALMTLVCAVIAACERRPLPGDSAVVGQSSVADVTASTVPVGARSVCDTVAARWRSVRQARVETRDSTANPINRNSIQQGLPDETLPQTPACVVAVEIDSGTTTSLPSYWPAAQWAELWIISADGPGSQLQTFQRGLVRCQMSSESDAGDPADSVAVASPWFTETTVCWQHPRPLVVSDTGHPPS
jgi:hypothetical protein